jgi:hypothetical protein
MKPLMTATVVLCLTAPLYGRWHALTERLLFAPDGSDVPLIFKDMSPSALSASAGRVKPALFGG